MERYLIDKGNELSFPLMMERFLMRSRYRHIQPAQRDTPGHAPVFVSGDFDRFLEELEPLAEAFAAAGWVPSMDEDPDELDMPDSGQLPQFPHNQ